MKSNKATRIPLAVACQRIDKVAGYDLRARSSISNTPLILANSIGTIDYAYRGQLMAAVHNLSPDEYIVKAGTKLFQICSPTLEPIEFSIVDHLDDSDRGSNGFGSTSKVQS
jgi:dUTP pyrophosphatase